MALRSGYKGVKKLAAGLKWNRPGVLAADDLALANVFFPRSEQAVLGAKNFLYVLDPTGTQSGVTYTVNKDSKGNVLNVAVSGTPTGYSAFAFWADVTPNEYILSHMDNATNFIWGEITLYKNGASVQDLPSLGTADDCTIDLSSYDFDRIKVVAKRVSDSVNTTATIYPMLRLATDTDSNYVPHAMTNKELTEKVQGIINAASNAADFAAFKTAIGNL